MFLWTKYSLTEGYEYIKSSYIHQKYQLRDADDYWVEDNRILKVIFKDYIYCYADCKNFIAKLAIIIYISTR